MIFYTLQYSEIDIYRTQNCLRSRRQSASHLSCRVVRSSQDRRKIADRNHAMVHNDRELRLEIRNRFPRRSSIDESTYSKSARNGSAIPRWRMTRLPWGARWRPASRMMQSELWSIFCIDNARNIAMETRDTRGLYIHALSLA